MTKLEAAIKALQENQKAPDCALILRVTAGRKTHDILCADLLDLVNAKSELKALGAKDLRQFGIWHDEHDGTVSVREVV